MHEGENAYYVTDLSLAEMAEGFSRTVPPLLTRALADTRSADSLEGKVALTAAGGEVLSGRQDRVSVCGIDRWLGGVHLQSDANLWWWDDGRQVIQRDRARSITQG